MRTEKAGSLLKFRFDSVTDLVETLGSFPEHWGNPFRAFHGVDSIQEAFELARDGWAEPLPRILQASEDAVSKVEQEHEVTSFTAVYDVAGCEVDVARYLDGTPENMIDYPLVPIVKAGRVITLCASVSVSGSVDVGALQRRGQATAALALALGRLGYSLEIYVDLTAERGGKRLSIRTLLKGAQDALDVERSIYALAHPSMLRALYFTAIRMGSDYGFNMGTSLGTPENPVEDLPEGSLYLPCLRSERDVPDADEQLLAWLRELEIITD